MKGCQSDSSAYIVEKQKHFISMKYSLQFFFLKSVVYKTVYAILMCVLLRVCVSVRVSASGRARACAYGCACVSECFKRIVNQSIKKLDS